MAEAPLRTLWSLILVFAPLSVWRLQRT